MRGTSRSDGWLVAAALGGLACLALAPARAQTTAPTPTDVPVAQLIDEMGDADFRVREGAMRHIIALGNAAVPAMRARLEVESDPEIRHRIRFVLEAVLPPEQAVLVIRSGTREISAGEIVTHVDLERVRSQRELGRLHRKSRDARHTLRVNGVEGAREVRDVDLDVLERTADYRAPQGEAIASAVRLYAAGYAEQAYAQLERLSTPPHSDELPPRLHAFIAYTAGHGRAAVELFDAQSTPSDPFAQRFGRDAWGLDSVGPFPAPYRFQTMLWEKELERGDRSYDTRDRALQATLIPPNRDLEALTTAAALWYHELRPFAARDQERTPAGNSLAVIGWMLSDLDLVSESVRVIEPRSRLLKVPQSFKWTRVQIGGWAAFLRGDVAGALDEAYENARSVIIDRSDPNYELIRNPRVAAGIALFLYQAPEDPRRSELHRLLLATEPDHRTLLSAAGWMAFSATPANAAAVRGDLLSLLPALNCGDGCAATVARWLATMLYAEGNDDPAALNSVREALGSAPPGVERDAWVAAFDAMRELAAGRPREAVRVLEPVRDQWQVRNLVETARFADEHGDAGRKRVELRNPLLAVPFDAARQNWLIVTRGAGLARYEVARDELTPIEPPTRNWLAGPVNWPWVGRDLAGGRVWLYDRRRVLEVTPNESHPVRLNIDADDVPRFETFVAPVFCSLGEALRDAPPPAGETGEFLRAEILANGEFVSDPDLHDVGYLAPVPQDERLVQLSLRGGPSLLIEPAAGKAWTSPWLARKLGEPAAPLFIAEALRGRPAPVAMLASDRGLIRFDTSDESVARVELPDGDSTRAIVPEWTPYVRRDPRWYYFAVPPSDGGQVYRLDVSSGTVEAVDMLNEALPAAYFRIRSRAALRCEIDERLGQLPSPVPALAALLEDARRTVEAVGEPP